MDQMGGQDERPIPVQLLSTFSSLSLLNMAVPAEFLQAKRLGFLSPKTEFLFSSTCVFSVLLLSMEMNGSCEMKMGWGSGMVREDSSPFGWTYGEKKLCKRSWRG